MGVSGVDGGACSSVLLAVCMMSCDSYFRTEDRGTGTYLFIPLGLSRPEALFDFFLSLFLMNDKAVFGSLL